MQLLQYNPFTGLQQVDKEMQRVFGNDGLWPSVIADSSAVDMYTENGKVVAEVTLPNFKKEEIKVVADDHTLEISAEHHEQEEKDSKRRYVLRESSRSFCRRIALPPGAETDDVTASFADGKLTVTMPLEEDEQPKEVPIT